MFVCVVFFSCASSATSSYPSLSIIWGYSSYDYVKMNAPNAFGVRDRVSWQLAYPNMANYVVKYKPKCVFVCVERK